MRTLPLFAALLFAVRSLAGEDMPDSVAELWADFDPRAGALETEVIREWRQGGLVLRVVRFQAGTYKGVPARLAAFYGFPEGQKDRLPGVLHLHGGGQRASLSEVKLLAKRGYAVLSLNWGGREMEEVASGDRNTDWGAVDPTQQNVAGYSSMLPGPKQVFEDREHPKNCNWYVLTAGCRRGLTFLEEQPEVDPLRLGVHGFSMGGNLTMYVAGTDARVKAAVPAVGGQGWRWQTHSFIGGTDVQERIRGDVERFGRTLSFESYAPLIRCPVLHRSGTNDFHGWMDDVYRTNALIPDQPVRSSWSPHLNHRLTPEVAVTMPLWFDHHLKGGPALPATPVSELDLSSGDGTPALHVTAVSEMTVLRCEIFYSVDPDPRARFWRSGEVIRNGNEFSARLPLYALDVPLFAFANVHYELPQPLALDLPGLPKEVATLCLSSGFHSVTAAGIAASGVIVTAAPDALIDDFSHGWRDWYTLNEGHSTLWQRWTRKLTDPAWRGPDGAALALTLEMKESNRLTFVIQENEWRRYRGKKRTFVCEKEIPGATGPQTVSLSLTDFKDEAGESPSTWSHLDQLGICAHFSESNAAPDPWNGPLPEFRRLEWRTDVLK
jgi:dienelactone hydrolase